MKRTIVLVVMCVVLAACWGNPDATQQHAIEALDEMLKQGRMTPEQHAALRAGFEARTSAGVDIVNQLVQGLLFAVATYFGVQWRRGPVATPQERVQRRARA